MNKQVKNISVELTQFVPQMWQVIYPHCSQLREQLTEKINDILRRVYSGKLSHVESKHQERSYKTGMHQVLYF